MTTPITLTYLHMALRFRAERASSAPGAALAALRVAIASEDDDGRLSAARHQLVAQEAARILRINLDDMPPATDDVALLVDAIAFRIGATTRADAWRSIGINPNRGRDLLARNAKAVDWPIWFTLRAAALQE